MLDALDRGEATTISTRRIGPALAFERVWEETGCRGVIERLASARKHDFALERAAFLTVLHRLLCGGSDRAADRWREDYRIDGVEGLELHHLYRAMAWLGEELSEDQQDAATPFAPRCVKDVMEEDLFTCRRDLLTTLDVVFMDTTRLYFEGAGGQTLGRRGFSKDHRGPARKDRQCRRPARQPVLRTREMKMLAKAIDQSRARVEGQSMLEPVHPQRDIQRGRIPSCLLRGRRRCACGHELSSNNSGAGGRSRHHHLPSCQIVVGHRRVP